MKTLIAIALLIVSTGCGAWSRPGTTEAEFRRDSYACERDQRMASSSFTTVRPYPYSENTAGAVGAGLTAANDASDQIGFFFRCMESKGYRWNAQTNTHKPWSGADEEWLQRQYVPRGVMTVEEWSKANGWTSYNSDK